MFILLAFLQLALNMITDALAFIISLHCFYASSSIYYGLTPILMSRLSALLSLVSASLSIVSTILPLFRSGWGLRWDFSLGYFVYHLLALVMIWCHITQLRLMKSKNPHPFRSKQILFVHDKSVINMADGSNTSALSLLWYKMNCTLS